jgi:hypothetical protein
MQTSPATCPACGAVVDPAAATCGECGAIQVAADPPAAPDPPPPTTRKRGRLELGPNEWYSTRVRNRPAAGQAGVFSDLPVDFPDTGGGRLAAFGLLVTAVSLLLPWAPVASFISYFDAWGLARLSTIGAFVAALVLLVIAIGPVRLPPRVRSGWLPALFGTFGLGLAWSRVDEGAGSVDIGGWLFILGAGLAVAGGLLALAARVEQPPKG